MNTSIDQTVKKKEERDAAAVTDHPAGDFSNLFLTIDLSIGKIDAQKAAIDQSMKGSVRKVGDAFIRTRIKVCQTFFQFCCGRVKGAEIQIPAIPVFLLINEIIQKDVQTLNPGEIGLFNELRKISAEVPLKGMRDEAEDSQGRSCAGGKLIPGHWWEVLLMTPEP